MKKKSLKKRMGIFHLFKSAKSSQVITGLLLVMASSASAQVEIYSRGTIDTVISKRAGMVAAGGNHSVVGDFDFGITAGWGDNSYGQTSGGYIPDLDFGPYRFIDAGQDHTVLLKGHNLDLRGRNDHGQSTVPPVLRNNTLAVAAGGYHNIAILLDSTVVAWGDNTYKQAVVPAGLGKVIAVAAGKYHSLAIKVDGTVVAWGDTTYGKTNVPAGLKATMIAAGDNHSVAYSTVEGIVSWGDDTYHQVKSAIKLPIGLQLIALAAGANHSVALCGIPQDAGLGGYDPHTNHEYTINSCKNGRIIGWGDNSDGQLDFLATLTDVVSISAGGNNTMAVKYKCQDGLLSYNGGNILPDGTVDEEYKFWTSSVTGGGTVLYRSNDGITNTGTGPFETIPDGITYDQVTQSFSGIPTTAGNYKIRINRGDGFCGSGYDFNLNVSEPGPNSDRHIKSDYSIQPGGTLTVNSLTVDGGVKLYAPEGSTLIINGDILNNGTIVIDNGASLIMTKEGASVTGNIQVKKQGWVTKKYNLMGIPVATAKASSLGTGVNSYDESKPYGAARWIAKSATSDLSPGVGYTAFNSKLVTFTGTPNNGNITVPVTRKEVGNDGVEGWNLVANPYPSAISYTVFMVANAGNVNNFIYLWDESGKTGYEYSNGDYLVYDGVTTVGGNGAGFNGSINSCQAFFVQKSANGAGSISFTNAMRSAGNNSSLLRVSSLPTPFFKVKLKSEAGQVNDLLVKFAEGALSGMDQNDASHMKGNPDLAFYSKVESQDLIINALPVEFPSVIQLGIDAAKAGTYKFSLSEINDFAGKNIFLEDLIADSVINLRDSDYSVYFTQTKNLLRFKLHVTDEVILSSVKNKSDNTFISSAEGKLLISTSAAGTKEVEITDLAGKEVYRLNFSQTGTSIFDVPVNSGIYVVKVNSGSSTSIDKVYLNK